MVEAAILEGREAKSVVWRRGSVKALGATRAVVEAAQAQLAVASGFRPRTEAHWNPRPRSEMYVLYHIFFAVDEHFFPDG